VAAKVKGWWKCVNSIQRLQNGLVRQQNSEFKVRQPAPSLFLKGMGSRQSHAIPEGNEECNSHSLLRQRYLILILAPTLMRYHSPHLALTNSRAYRNVTHGMSQPFSHSSLFVGLKRVVCYPGYLTSNSQFPLAWYKNYLSSLSVAVNGHNPCKLPT